MSEENVEVVRRGFALFNARAVEELVALCDPDCVWLPFRAQLEGVPYHGHAGVRQFVRDMDADWEAFSIEPVEFRHRDELVGAIGKVTAVGRGSGADIGSMAGFVFEMRAGLIARLVSHSDPSVALEAIGPSGPGSARRGLS